MKLKVLSGDLSRRSAIFPWIPYPVINWGLAKGSGYSLAPKSLKSVDIRTQQDQVQKGKVGAAAGMGCCLLGPLGLLGGGLVSKKRLMIVDVELEDGRKFVAELDQDAYKVLLKAL